MIKTPEQYDLLKELIEDNKNDSFLTEELVRFVERLLWEYSDKALNNRVWTEGR